MEHGSTIAAVSTPPGRSERAVVRLSGPRARTITEACCRSGGRALALRARGATRARLDDGAGEQPVLVLWMPGPRSFTGEDVVEWHLRGSPPLCAAALRRALELGAEAARPGEFTRRAFQNGRLDLARAEGVLALVRARNESERRAATALLFGGLSARVAALRDALEHVRALSEASLDFDESETGGVPREELRSLADGILAGLDEALAWERAREAPAGLPRAALVGRPNAGKSSLFNRLAGASALVSERAGTTRDPLRGVWRAGACELELWDLAGEVPAVPEAPEVPGGSEPDPAESEELPDRLARERAREVRASADLWLWVVDASAPVHDLRRERLGAPADEARGPGAAAEPGPEAQGDAPPCVLVLHKLDAATPERRAAWDAELLERAPACVRAVVGASSRTGAGLDALAAAAEALQQAGSAATGEVRELSARHRAALAAARTAVAEARELFARAGPLDLAAHALRGATDALDGIAGRTTPEDLLDRIFERFCLGK